MEPRDSRERITDGGIIAIVRMPSADGFTEVATALVAGGVDVIECTMTTRGALDALHDAASRFGDRVLLGAGTVLDAETGRAAILAGARFIVSPIVSPKLIRTCRRYGVVSIPGAFTPTEIARARDDGADLIKVFPAARLGPGYIREILAPLPGLKLVPTGGINEDNAEAFLHSGAVALGIGSKLVNAAELTSPGGYRALSDRAAAFRSIVRAARQGPSDS